MRDLNHHRRVRSGFTLVELLVVIGIISILMGILLPALSIVREQSYRAKCASNLRQIAAACLTYANNNDGHFPRTYWQSGVGLTNSCLGGLGSAAVSIISFDNTGSNPTGPVGADNDGASLYLLLRNGLVPPDIFRCPSNAQAQKLDPSTIMNYANFPSPMRVYNSYSYATQFPNQAAVNVGWHYDVTTTADYPIASDLNPGNGAPVANGSGQTHNVFGVNYYDSPRTMAIANSDNHRCVGQNVAYVDGRVEWHTSPFCGPSRTYFANGAEMTYPFGDNIFCGYANMTNAATGLGGAFDEPQDMWDVVMEPRSGAK